MLLSDKTLVYLSFQSSVYLSARPRAFATGATGGLAAVAQGFEWQRDDEVLIARDVVLYTGLLTAMMAATQGLVANDIKRVLAYSTVSQLGYMFLAMGVGAFLAFAQWHDWHLPAVVQFVCVVGFSAMGGVIPGTLFSLAVRLAPSDDTVATTVGWVQQWSSIGQFAGPPLVAWAAATAATKPKIVDTREKQVIGGCLRADVTRVPPVSLKIT